jgi:hypothetical protein
MDRKALIKRAATAALRSLEHRDFADTDAEIVAEQVVREAVGDVTQAEIEIAMAELMDDENRGPWPPKRGFTARSR